MSRGAPFATAIIGALALGLAALCAPPAAAEVRFHGETGGGAYAVPVMTWRDIPFRTIVRQRYDYSCGSAALATLLRHHYGRPVGEAEIFQAMFAAGDRAQIRRAGFSLLDMRRYLEAQGLRAEGYRLSLAELALLDRPAIVVIDTAGYRHFVVVKGVRAGEVLVGDPALGLKIYTAAEFARVWRGIAFALVDAPGAFNRADEWAPWAQAARDEDILARPVDALTRDLAPLYQITPSIIIPGGGL